MLINGKFAGLEIKTEKGKMSEAQKGAKEEIEKAGGYYFIIRSIDDVREAIDFLK